MLIPTERASQPAPAASQRPVPVLRSSIPSAELTVTRHRSEVQVLHPSALPLACSPRMERAPSGFCLSFEPRRGRRRRTSGRGQATSTGLELRLRSMFEPPINAFTQCVRPRVAGPSGLPQPVATRIERAALGPCPWASHPADQEPDDARRGGDRPSSTDLGNYRSTHIRRSPIR